MPHPIPSGFSRSTAHTHRSVCLAQLTDAPERDMLVTLMDCPELKDIVPTFTREVPLEQFIGKEPGKDAVVVELQDVTSGFGKDPCIMDVKLGTAPGGKSLAPPRPSCPQQAIVWHAGALLPRGKSSRAALLAWGGLICFVPSSPLRHADVPRGRGRQSQGARRAAQDRHPNPARTRNPEPEPCPPLTRSRTLTLTPTPTLTLALTLTLTPP